MKKILPVIFFCFLVSRSFGAFSLIATSYYSTAYSGGWRVGIYWDGNTSSPTYKILVTAAPSSGMTISYSGTFSGSFTTTSTGETDGPSFTLSDSGALYTNLPLGSTSETFTFSSGTTYTLTMTATITNNLNKSETVAFGNSATQTVAALSNSSYTFVASGVSGYGPLALSSTPDTIVDTGVHDPLYIASANTSISTTARIGATPTPRTVNVLVFSYATSAVTLTPTLDGGSLTGSVVATASPDGGKSPGITTKSYNVSLSGDSTVNFTVASGHTISETVKNVGSIFTYEFTIDSASQTSGYATTITPGSANGDVSAVTTNTSTGATTVGTSQAPVANETSLGASGGEQTSPVQSVGNTSSAAGSAANQLAANSLASIDSNLQSGEQQQHADLQQLDSDLNAFKAANHADMTPVDTSVAPANTVIAAGSSGVNSSTSSGITSVTNAVHTALGGSGTATSNTAFTGTGVAPAATGAADGMLTPSSDDTPFGTIQLSPAIRSLPAQSYTLSISSSVGGILSGLITVMAQISAWLAAIWFVFAVQRKTSEVAGHYAGIGTQMTQPSIEANYVPGSQFLKLILLAATYVTVLSALWAALIVVVNTAISGQGISVGNLFHGSSIASSVPWFNTWGGKLFGILIDSGAVSVWLTLLATYWVICWQIDAILLGSVAILKFITA